MTHDYKRHGTTTLFAALNVLDGQVIGQCQQRHTHAEWLKFLRKIDRETPKDKTLHLIADNYATHKHPAVQAWLDKHPRFNMHFTPTSASWLNMVERFFRDITTERLRRGVFTSVPELENAINEYVAHHNTNPKPFIWTKSARDILQKVIRANARLSLNRTKHYTSRRVRRPHLPRCEPARSARAAAEPLLPRDQPEDREVARAVNSVDAQTTRRRVNRMTLFKRTEGAVEVTDSQAVEAGLNSPAQSREPTIQADMQMRFGHDLRLRRTNIGVPEESRPSDRYRAANGFKDAQCRRRGHTVP